MIIMPITSPAASADSEATSVPSIRPSEREGRGDGQRREEAEHHRRDAGQDLQHRLDPGAERRRGIFRHVDCGEQADRAGDQHRDQRDEHGAGEQRHRRRRRRRSRPGRPERRLRAPLQTEQEFDRRHLGKEAHGLEQHRQDDADGGQHGDAGAGDQQSLDHPLDRVAGAEVGADAAAREKIAEATQHEPDRQQSGEGPVDQGLGSAAGLDDRWRIAGELAGR